MDFKFFTGDGSTGHFSLLPNYQDENDYYTLEMDKNFYDLLCKGEISRLQDLLNQLFNSVISGNSSRGRILGTLRDVLNTCSRAAKFYEGSLHALEGKYGLSPFEMLEALDTLVEIQEWLVDFSRSFV